MDIILPFPHSVLTAETVFHECSDSNKSFTLFTLVKTYQLILLLLNPPKPVHMKNILLRLFAVSILFSVSADAQITVFSENFDSASVSMTSTGVPGYAVSSGFFSSPAHSILGQFNTAGESSLTSPSFSTSGNNYVLLSFDHICKVSFFDSCLVEYSADNGITWTTITPFNSVYTGASPVYAAIGNFNAGAYAMWDFANPATISNSWWQPESYDVSALLGNQANLRIRFRCKDDANANGMQGYLGWLIDNIKVVMSPCELLKPSVSYTGFHPNGTTFGNGPFTITTAMTDGNSGIDTASAVLHYTVTSGGVTNIYNDPMYFVSGTLNNAVMEATFPVFQPDDTICYYVSVNDLCGNSDSTALTCAYISSGIVIPYIDGFDSGNAGWADTTLSGSFWQLGTPNFGLTTGALSNPNAWDVDLNAAYQSSTDSRLYSPVFDFTGITTATLSFWQNYFNEPGWDGVRLETSIDRGATWQILGTVNDPLATNWYQSNINSSNLPAWNGTSTGWEHSTYPLSGFSNVPDLRMRFVFTSDVSVEKDGHSIDDFSITLPPDDDLNALAISVVQSSAAGTSNVAAVVVSNDGQLVANSFQVQITVNGVPVDTVNAPGPLLPLDTIILVGNYITPPGIFTICGTIIYPADTSASNNTVCTTSLGIATENVPYFNDFETTGNDWETTSNLLTTKWEYGTPAFGLTTGAYSGVKCWDINLNATYTDNATSYLYSPYFNISATPNPIRVSFFNNFNTVAGLDGVYLEYEMDQSGLWAVAGTYNDLSGYNWYNDSVNIQFRYQFGGNSNGWENAYLNLPVAGNKIRFRFVFKSGAGGLLKDGYSIDNFSVTTIPTDDVGVIDISNYSGQSGNSIGPVIYIRNSGASPQTGFPVTYTLNGVVSGSQTYAGTLNPGQIDLISMNSFVVPTGPFDICAYTSLNTDTDRSNDTLCKDAVGVTTQLLPYADDFEGTQYWSVITTGNVGTNWELGLPAFGATTGTHSGLNCWDVNLTTTYTVDAITALYSPYFDFTGASHDTVSFWQNYNNETNWDGVRLEYDINNANNWQVLGAMGDGLGTNWYNDNSLNSSLLPGWTNTSVGWIQSKYPLSVIGTPSIVQFRFVFTSDGAVTNDGHSIDDFRISVAYQNDVAVTGVTSPGVNAGAGVPTSLDVTVQNAGLNTSSAFNIYYSLNGAAPVAVNYSSPIASFSSVNINLASIIPVSGNNTLKIYTDWASDLNRANDTLNYSFSAEQTFTVPYTNDFETADINWTSVPSVTGTAWAWGTPAFGATTGAHGGTSCWDVNLTTPYNNASTTYLESPPFSFFNTTQTQLSCWINYNTEFGADGCIIEYTFDDATWQALGVFSDPNATNWYNAAIVSAFSGSAAWSGNSNSWQQITYNTSLFDGQPFVRLRYSFRSDVNLSGDGISMDDFSITGTVDIDNPENKQSLVLVYPNPAGNVLYIKTQANAPQVEVMNTSGQAVMVKTVASAAGTTQLDISSLPSGVYLVKVFDNDNVSFHKVIVE